MAAPGMMNRQIRLRAPAQKVASDFGEMVDDGAPTVYRVWASWREDGAGESLAEGKEFGVTKIMCDIWWHANLADIDVQWTVIGENGSEYDIVSTEELGGRRWQIRMRLLLRG